MAVYLIAHALNYVFQRTDENVQRMFAELWNVGKRLEFGIENIQFSCRDASGVI